MSVTVSKEPSVSAYDEATNTAFLGKTENNTFVFTGKASNKWCIGAVPNGGYVLGIIIDSVIRHFASKHQTDPIALNAFFFNKTIPGHLIIEIEELKMSRKGYCIVRAILKQREDLQPLSNLTNYNPSEWKDKVQGVFTMGNMDSEEGVTHFHKNPSPPSLKNLTPYKYNFMGEFLDCQFDQSVFPKSESEAGKPEVTQIMAFTDGRPVDAKSVPYWCDMFITPPVLLGPAILGGPVWCPTMQLEVQFKRKCTGKKVICHFVAPHIINGRFDITGDIFNENGEILALTRHQCLVVPWSRNTKDPQAQEARMKHMMNKSNL